MPSTTRKAVRATLLASVAAVFFGAGAAQANPAFPGALQTTLKMPCPPPCTMCHLTDAGGFGTLKPGYIGSKWRDNFGLDGTSLPSLMTAIMAAQDAKFDTDGDGMPDTVELSMAENPNDPTNAAPLCVAGSTSTGSEQPVYGCARVAPQGHVDNVAAAASALVALVGMAALRRRTARRGTPR